MYGVPDVPRGISFPIISIRIFPDKTALYLIAPKVT